MDTVVDGVSYDTVLIILVEIITSSIYTGRHVYSNPLDEPLMFSYMYQWVSRGLEEKTQVSEAMSKAEAPLS